MRMRDKFHCYMPNTTTWQEAKPLTLEGAPRRARGEYQVWGGSNGSRGATVDFTGSTSVNAAHGCSEPSSGPADRLRDNSE